MFQNTVFKKWLEKIKGLVALVIGGASKFEKFLIDNVDEAIDIVSVIRKAVENPVIITIMMVMPEKYRAASKEVLARVESVLDRVLAELTISNGCLQKPTTGERLRCFIEHMRQLKPAAQEAYYMKMASLYTQYSTDTTAKRAVVDTAVQGRFLERFGDVENASV